VIRETQTQKDWMPKSPGLNFRQATTLIANVCEIAGHRDLIGEARKALGQAGILKAVREHNQAVLFDWLIWSLSYQGVSDAVASGYMEVHGSASAEYIAQGLADPIRCQKLQNFAAFRRPLPALAPLKGKPEKVTPPSQKWFGCVIILRMFF
jgi:hypothetical protein